MTPPTRSRWLFLALLASLGANMFLAGYLLGARPPFGPPPGPPNPLRLLEHMAEQLPPDDASLLRAAVESNRPELDELGRRHREFPDRVRAVLRADPFDPQALARLFEEQDRREAQVRERFQSVLIKVAAAMSPEGRRRIAGFRPEDHPPPPGRDR